jgi:hypothetical protein
MTHPEITTCTSGNRCTTCQRRSAGRTRKLAHLRANPTIAVVVRAGRQWTAVDVIHLEGQMV